MRTRSRLVTQLVGAGLAVGVACTPAATETAPGGLTAVANAGSAGSGPRHCPVDPAAPEPMRRLSVEQYQNTLADFFADDATLHPVLDALQRGLGQLPRDGQVGASFAGMDGRIGPRHMSTYIQVADDVGRLVVSEKERLGALAGPCALAPELDAKCLTEFVRHFGRRAWRRPLTDGERERIVGLARSAASAPESYQLALAHLLSAPELLVRRERGSDAYALASQLSLHFWQTRPDAALCSLPPSGVSSMRPPAMARKSIV